MVYSLNSIALVGLQPQIVTCEVDLTYQIPQIVIVGLASQLTLESKERIKSAVQNSGFDWPARKVTINMLPAALPKFGTHFELSMVLSVLACQSSLITKLRNIFVFGECSLSGEIRPCGWLSRCVPFLENHNAKVIIAHDEDIESINLINPNLKNKIELIPAQNIRQAWQELVNLSLKLNAEDLNAKYLVVKKENFFKFDLLRKVKDEKLGVCAALMAIAARKSVLFAGPHGTGKSMLIQSILECQKVLKNDAKIELNSLYTMMGMTSASNIVPVVNIQPNITRAGLEGSILSNGQIIAGELTRAHLGTLVADEFLEFRQDVIEAFRVPIEEKKVLIQRAKFKTELPADFQLLASTNLCKCGKMGVRGNYCKCSKSKRNEYLQKCSGPILDRFDMTLMIGSNTDSMITESLNKLVQDILNQELWQSRISKMWEQENVFPESMNEFDMNQNKSKRYHQKCSELANVIARFVGHKVAKLHFELALLLKQEIFTRYQSDETNYMEHMLKLKKHSDINVIN